MLRQVISRRPTLLLTARAPLTGEQVAAVCDLLTPSATPSSVDVRPYVGATDPERRGTYFPLNTSELPPVAVARRLAKALGRRSRVGLLVSPDLLGAPSEEDEPEAEPGSIEIDDPEQLRGYEEPDVVGEPELEAIGDDAELVREDEDEAVGEEE